MSKRKLTRQQQFRIDRVQQERLARAEKKGKNIEKKFDDGSLGEPLDGLVIAHYGATLDVETPTGSVVRCSVRSNLPALVTGDHVIWHADGERGVISANAPRRSVLSRPDARGQLKPVAANISRIVIVIAPAPRTPVNLIDRYLVAAAHDDIPAVILLNKTDLLDQAPDILNELNQYEALGYPTHQACAQDPEGLAIIRELVSEGHSVFVGQSGVGKSSIINRLLPSADLKVGEISDATGKGKHTTTTAKLFHIPSGGCLIDSPGIREFGLWHTTDDDLAKGFSEITEHAGHCKFNDCTHTHEPGCEVKKAVDDGLILERRLESYLSIKASVGEVTMRNG